MMRAFGFLMKTLTRQDILEEYLSKVQRGCEPGSKLIEATAKALSNDDDPDPKMLELLVAAHDGSFDAVLELKARVCPSKQLAGLHEFMGDYSVRLIPGDLTGKGASPGHAGLEAVLKAVVEADRRAREDDAAQLAAA